MIGNIDNPAGQIISLFGLPQPPEITRPTTPPEDLRLKKTSARSFVTTLTKKDIEQPSVPSHPSQKSSVSFGNLRVGDWC